MEHTGSAPPPSPVPPPPEHVPRDPFPSGWRPADDDDSARAVAWRARRGMRIAEETREEHRELAAAVRGLSGTIETWSETWGGRWASAVKVAKWAAALVGGAAVLGAAREAWEWFRTLHH